MDEMKLDPVAARVLGVLIEKQMTTPDAYPLTLAATVAGCNQSTNRDPVMSLQDDEVERALVRLHELSLATPVRGQSDRVTKYRHKVPDTLEIGEPSQAVMAVLLLRGPQTAGELRSRTGRYTTFGSVDEVETVIDRLEEAGLARRFPRLPGQSQRRVGETLSSDREESLSPASVSPAGSGLAERLADLEERFEELLRRLGVDDL